MKCETTEAMNKCNCKWCKLFRECMDQQLEIVVKEFIKKNEEEMLR